MTGFVYQYPREVSNDRGKEDQHDITGIPAHIEEIAAHEQPELAKPGGNDHIQDHNDREKDKKIDTVK